MGLRLVAIDLDETLLKKDKTYDIDRFSKIVDQLKQAGIIVCIASGNYIPKIRHYVADADHSKLYFAGDNGNIIVSNKQVLDIKTITNDTFYEITQHLLAKEEYEFVVSDGFKVYSTYVSAASSDYINIYYDQIEMLETYDDLPADFHMTKIAILSKNSLRSDKKLKQQLMKQFSQIAVVTSGGGWIDIYSENGGKGSAIKYLQKKYTIKKAETIAFGDSLNDESMMNEAAFSVAMNNADMDLKKVCNYEIGTNEDQSVLSVLETYLNHRSMAFIEKYRLTVGIR